MGFFERCSCKNGVNENDILKEDRATFTWENAKYSRMVTDRNGICVKKAIICCKTYHARRALMYYQKAYPEIELLVCPSDADGINRRNWKNTEEGIQVVTGEVTRIISQFSLMMVGEKDRIMSESFFAVQSSEIMCEIMYYK